MCGDKVSAKISALYVNNLTAEAGELLEINKWKF